MFQAVQGPDGLIWTNEERAALQAFLSNFSSKEGVNVTILEAGEGDRSPGGSQCFQKAVDSGKEELEHNVMGCWDCWVHGDIVYYEKSKYHPNHPLLNWRLINRSYGSLVIAHKQAEHSALKPIDRINL